MINWEDVAWLKIMSKEGKELGAAYLRFVESINISRGLVSRDSELVKLDVEVLSPRERRETPLAEMIADANAAQTAMELAEKLIAIRNSPHGSKATIRELRAFLAKCP